MLRRAFHRTRQVNLRKISRSLRRQIEEFFSPAIALFLELADLAAGKYFGYRPSPHSLNDPKSLYHSSSGTSGSDSIQSRSWLRSARVMLLSRILSIRCCRNAEGKLDHSSILGITCRKPCVRVPRQGAQPPSDPLQIESARQARRRPSPFVVLPRDLLRRVQ